MRNPDCIGVVPSPLGKNAKSIYPPPLVDVPALVRSGRLERYALQNSARSLLLGAGKRAGLQYPTNYHRTCKCKYVRHGGDAVSVLQSQGRAFYGNLVTCGSIWVCTICGAKIQERRRQEIAQAIEWAYKNGHQPMMVTFTFPHKSWQKLGDLLRMQAKALKLLRTGSPWQRFIDRMKYEGLIRSLELTHGRAAWHPHTHELWFLDKDADAEKVRAEVSKMWASACARAGLLDLNNKAQVEAFEFHAVDVIGNCDTSDYLAKMDDSKHWGADRELAKATSKKGRASGKHPFGLLADYATGDQRAGRLFLAYAIATKGKRQIFWSKGLKARVGVGEVSDEVLAEQEREEASVLGMLTDDDWQLVREAGQRGQLLNAAEVGGWQAVESLLDEIISAAIARYEHLLGRGGGDTSQAQAAAP